MTESFNAALAVELGGWDARYARVLAIYEREGLAIAVVDANGDGREVEAELYDLAPNGRWRDLVSGLGTGATDEVVWNCGYTPSRATVPVTYAGQTYTVPVVAETGTWYFAARRSADDTADHAVFPTGPPNEPWAPST